MGRPLAGFGVLRVTATRNSVLVTKSHFDLELNKEQVFCKINKNYFLVSSNKGFISQKLVKKIYSVQNNWLSVTYWFAI